MIGEVDAGFDGDLQPSLHGTSKNPIRIQRRSVTSAGSRKVFERLLQHE